MATVKQRQASADYEVLCARWRALTADDLTPGDEDAQAELKQIRQRIRKLNRCVHDCPIVEIDVPSHSAATNGNKPLPPKPFRLANAAGERTYLGLVTVPRCIAHELLALIASDRQNDTHRMQARGNTVNLHENARISDIARQIAST